MRVVLVLHALALGVGLFEQTTAVMTVVGQSLRDK
jgi:hypothetical protein